VISKSPTDHSYEAVHDRGVVLRRRNHPGLRYARAFAVVAIPTAYFSYVFQFTTGTPWAYGLAGWLDPYFINALLEHWYFSVLRLENPVSPPMFFPAAGTLGYSHGLILFAPLYLAVRPFVDAFLAHTLTIFFAAELGAVCLYVLLRRAGAGFLEGLVLAAFFFTSANVINHTTGVWSQRASVFLIPPILLLLSSACRMRAGAPGLIAGALGGLLAALLLIQDFYTAAFAVVVFGLMVPGLLFRRVLAPAAAADGVPSTPRARPHDAWLGLGVVSLVVALLVGLGPIDRFEIAGMGFSARDPSRPLLVGLLCVGWYVERRWGLAAWLASRVTSATGAERRLAGAIGIGAAVGCGLFIWAYLGSYREHNQFPEDHLWTQLHRPTLDWHNPGSLIQNLVVHESGRTFALVLLLTLLAFTPALRVGRAQRLQLVWLMIVSTIILAIPLRTDHVSVWMLTFGWLPGLKAIRDPKRIVYIYELAAVLAIALALAGEARRSAFRVIAICLAAALMAFDWNGRVFDYGRSREQFDHWVGAPITVDPSCRSFFVRVASPSYMSRSGHMYSLYASDALFVALRLRIPTLNGYSAWVPPEFRMLHPNDSDYMDHVKAWIRRNQLQGVCVLDMDARTMTPFRE
jgi:hypothetical protein